MDETLTEQNRRRSARRAQLILGIRCGAILTERRHAHGAQRLPYVMRQSSTVFDALSQVVIVDSEQCKLETLGDLCGHPKKGCGVSTVHGWFAMVFRKRDAGDGDLGSSRLLARLSSNACRHGTVRYTVETSKSITATPHSTISYHAINTAML